MSLLPYDTRFYDAFPEGFKSDVMKKRDDKNTPTDADRPDQSPNLAVDIVTTAVMPYLS